MTWLKKQFQPNKHKCDLPINDGIEGDLWKCDDCKKIWERRIVATWQTNPGIPSSSEYKLEWKPAGWLIWRKYNE